MDRRPHLLLASRSFLGDGRTCDVATTTKTTSRLSDRYLPETIEHDVTHTRRPVRQNRPVSTSRRPPGPLTSDEAQPLRSPADYCTTNNLQRLRTKKNHEQFNCFLSHVSIREHAERDVVISFLSVCPMPVLCRYVCISHVVKLFTPSAMAVSPLFTHYNVI